MGDGLAFIEGKFCPLSEAKVSVFDPGFTHSDVVYDVVSVWKGHFFRLEEHIERFLVSCAGTRLKCPYSAAELKDILARLVIDGGHAVVPDTPGLGIEWDWAALHARQIEHCEIR